MSWGLGRFRRTWDCSSPWSRSRWRMSECRQCAGHGRLWLVAARARRMIPQTGRRSPLGAPSIPLHVLRGFSWVRGHLALMFLPFVCAREAAGASRERIHAFGALRAGCPRTQSRAGGKAAPEGRRQDRHAGGQGDRTVQNGQALRVVGRGRSPIADAARGSPGNRAPEYRGREWRARRPVRRLTPLDRAPGLVRRRGPSTRSAGRPNRGAPSARSWRGTTYR